MPPAVSAIIGAALATFGPFGAAIGSLSLFASFLIRAGVGLLLGALSAPKKTGAPPAANTGFRVTARGSSIFHPYIYGEVKVFGAEVYRESTGTDNKYFHQVLVFAGHEIDSYVEYWIDDYLVTLDGSGDVNSATKNDGSTTTRWNGLIRILPHYGTETQVAENQLVNASSQWTSTCTLYGLAYLYVRFTSDPNAYPNGIPVITARIRGKKLFDSRDSAQSEANPTTWLWSDNPALVLRDYLRGEHGIGEDSSHIDENLVQAAADDCDVLISGAKKFTCNGTFLSNVKPIDQIPAILTSMAGLTWYGQGKNRMRAGVWTPPVMDVNEDDLRSSLEVSPRHSGRDVFNTIKGLFRGAETDWQDTDYPPVSNTAFVIEDGNEEIAIDVDLPFTTDSIRARRIARILLEGHRQQIMVEAAFGLRLVGVQVGDNIRLTNTRFGWTNKEFLVVAWSLNIVPGGEDEPPDIQVKLSLRETAASIYDEVSDGVVYSRDNTTLPSPFFVPAVGVTPTASLQIVAEKVSRVISVDVTASNAGQLDRVEVEYKLATASTWILVGSGQLGRFEIFDVLDLDYDIRARGINTFGVRGDWTTFTNFQPSLSSSPTDVTGFTAIVNDANINLFWDAAVDLDLSYYEIRHALEETGATWSNSTTAVNKIARPATTVVVPSRPGTYMIRAVSKTGATSQNYTSVVVPETDLRDYTTTTTQTEETLFSGTKTDCSVTSNELRIDYPSEDEGLLVYSEQLNTWPNYAANTAVTANDTTAPDGTTTADLVKPDATSGAIAHYIRQSNAGVTVVQNAWYNMSVYAKADVLNFIRIRAFHLGGTGGSDDEATFDLSNGTIIQAGVETNTGAVITPEGNGWYRISIDVLNDVDTDSQFSINLLLTGDNAGEIYDGTINTGGFWVWGFQVTKGKGVKTYHKSVANTLNDYAEYLFSNYIDTTAVRRVRARVDINLNRYDASGGLFDDLSGYIDTMPGLWDDLTANPQKSDVDVVTYISATNDDPAGTPVWSAYRAFQAGEFSGRAFRFKAKLITKSHDVTPSISGLTARVQY